MRIFPTNRTDSILKREHLKRKMQFPVAKLLTICTIALILASWLVVADATYRKPPFNGSIFGKRGATNEYDSTSKALSAMCEIASEACLTWFPAQEK